MQLTIETREWLIKTGVTGKKLDDLIDRYKSGLITAMVYPDAALPELRVCCDIMAWLFLLDDLSDVMDNRGSRAAGEVIMNSLHHPDTYTSPDLLGKMGREFVFRLSLCLLDSHHELEQFLEAICSHCVDGRTEKIYRDVGGRTSGRKSAK